MKHDNETAALAALACVDLDAWPIHEPERADYARQVAGVRKSLQEVGCARIDGFIRPDYRQAFHKEVNEVAPSAHFSTSSINPYFTPDDPDLPASHPRRRYAENTNGFVAMDRFEQNGLSLSLYRNPAFQRFIADCLEEETLFTFDDPLAGVVVNVMKEGQQLAWHYDTNEFIVSLLTRKPHEGGAFEYVPDLRQPGDECYDEVEKVLDGHSERVRSLSLELGDLQIFKGRFSLHRVVKGLGERHTVIFGYAKEPGFIGRVERTRKVHNRVTQAHIDAEKRARNDGLAD
ncbi:HalD/BesD family halogenase [Roseibium sp.]|uniref:HalD/BesD family halogenase n=1 Tax=Roseibium sp. TaxID=1936156 RepID=UPI003B50897F